MRTWIRQPAAAEVPPSQAVIGGSATGHSSRIMLGLCACTTWPAVRNRSADARAHLGGHAPGVYVIWGFGGPDPALRGAVNPRRLAGPAERLSWRAPRSRKWRFATEGPPLPHRRGVTWNGKQVNGLPDDDRAVVHRIGTKPSARSRVVP